MLLNGFKGMKARQAKIPPRESALFDAAETLARFYSATEKPDLAAKWRKEAEGLKPVGWGGGGGPPTPPKKRF
jgi:hypothetical protein